jgi:hypothetical protein
MEPFGNFGILRPEPKGGVFGMASVADYRRHASECVRLAQRMQDSKDKALLLSMAESWRRLAEQAETRDQKKNSNK